MYLDTAILLKLVSPEPDSRFFGKLVDRQTACSSELALTECFSALLRKEREGALDRLSRARAYKQVLADASSRRLTLLPMTRDVLDAARRILEAVHPKVALRSLDAIHLASAERLQSWPLCTTDVRMREAAAALGMPLCALP